MPGSFACSQLACFPSSRRSWVLQSRAYGRHSVDAPQQPTDTGFLRMPAPVMMVHKNKLPMAPTDALLIITGSMGSGKTAVLSEASDILVVRNIPHASIDLDALGTMHLPSSVEDNQLMYRNLRSVWENYAQVGLTRLLLARAIEDRAELECCRAGLTGRVSVFREYLWLSGGWPARHEVEPSERPSAARARLPRAHRIHSTWSDR